MASTAAWIAAVGVPGWMIVTFGPKSGAVTGWFADAAPARPSAARAAAVATTRRKAMAGPLSGGDWRQHGPNKARAGLSTAQCAHVRVSSRRHLVPADPGTRPGRRGGVLQGRLR